MHLRGIIAGSVPDASRRLHGQSRSVPIGLLAAGSVLGSQATMAAGRTVLVAVGDQLVGGLTLVALDGLAARIVVCPPGLAPQHLQAVASTAGVDLVVSDRPDLVPGVPTVAPLETPVPQDSFEPTCRTEWLLLTSGTTGAPKLVSHTLEGLTGAIAPAPPSIVPPVWATFYDIRRYGGLQIFLRALLGTGSMVLPDVDEPLAQVLARFGAQGVTHVSGTPSHWRRVLMNPAAVAMQPAYVRLSGEIADQAVLDALAARYPHASVGHAYASTEAGVGFEVTDGREGFPASFVEQGVGTVAMKVEGDTLRIRSMRTASRYVGAEIPLKDADGFVDTGDIVERRGDRYYFAGRRGGIINIGGQKVHPEEIEGIINRHRAVRMSLVKSRRSPITGALVAADVVLADADADTDAVRREIAEACQGALPAWKVPATIRFVAALDMTGAGKLARQG